MGCKHSSELPKNCILPHSVPPEVVKKESSAVFAVQSTVDDEIMAEEQKIAKIKLRAMAFDVLMSKKYGRKWAARVSPGAIVSKLEKGGEDRFSPEERKMLLEILKEQKLKAMGKGTDVSPEEQARLEEEKKKLKQDYLRMRKTLKEKLRKRKAERAERRRQLIELASRKH